MASEITKKRMSQEIQLLKNLSADHKVVIKKSSLGEHFFADLKGSLVKSEFADPNQKVYKFEILLDSYFPFKAPHVYCLTPFSNSSLIDRRDLFIDISRRQWVSSQTVYELIKLIPDFISDVLISESANEQKFFGTFHLGMRYDVNEWKQAALKGVNYHVVICDEIDPNEPRTGKTRYLVITDNALLLLEPEGRSKQQNGILVSWATLQSLEKLRRNLDIENVIAFCWLEQKEKEWILKFQNATEVINCVISKMGNLGVKSERRQFNHKKILAKEVTEEAIRSFNISQVLDLIAVYESAIVQDITLENIQNLMALYQKAIEYYSAMDTKRFTDFLNRLQTLLKREDIQVVLNSATEKYDLPPKKEEGKSEVEAEPSKEELEQEAKGGVELEEELIAKSTGAVGEGEGGAQIEVDPEVEGDHKE